MRLLQGLALRPLGEEFIVTGDSLARIDFSKVVSLNATAAWLWRELQDREFCTEDLVVLLTGRYEVDEATARADAEKLIAGWRRSGLLEPELP